MPIVGLLQLGSRNLGGNGNKKDFIVQGKLRKL
jgi:hypothetical protein